MYQSESVPIGNWESIYLAPVQSRAYTRGPHRLLTACRSGLEDVYRGRSFDIFTSSMIGYGAPITSCMRWGAGAHPNLYLYARMGFCGARIPPPPQVFPHPGRKYRLTYLGSGATYTNSPRDHPERKNLTLERAAAVARHTPGHNTHHRNDRAPETCHVSG